MKMLKNSGGGGRSGGRGGCESRIGVIVQYAKKSGGVGVRSGVGGSGGLM